MKIGLAISVVVSAMSIAGAAHADPVLLSGTGPSAAPAGRQLAGSAAFSAAYRLGSTHGQMLLNAPAGNNQQTILRSDIGTLKQVKGVEWSFLLKHTASSGYLLTMTGTRNEDRSSTTWTLKWNSTSGLSGFGAGLPNLPSGGGAPINALQLAGRATRESGSSGMSFTNLQFYSPTLGAASYGADSLSSRGEQFANLWLDFGAQTDLRQHSWTVSGMISGFRDAPIGGETGVELDIFGQTMMSVVPLPPAAWAGLSTLAAVAGVGFIRRRRIAGN